MKIWHTMDEENGLRFSFTQPDNRGLWFLADMDEEKVKRYLSLEAELEALQDELYDETLRIQDKFIDDTGGYVCNCNDSVKNI